MIPSSAKGVWWYLTSLVQQTCIEQTNHNFFSYDSFFSSPDDSQAASRMIPWRVSFTDDPWEVFMTPMSFQTLGVKVLRAAPSVCLYNRTANLPLATLQSQAQVKLVFYVSTTTADSLCPLTFLQRLLSWLEVNGGPPNSPLEARRM